MSEPDPINELADAVIALSESDRERFRGRLFSRLCRYCWRERAEGRDCYCWNDE